jgi:hypothetical protein
MDELYHRALPDPSVNSWDELARRERVRSFHQLYKDLITDADTGRAKADQPDQAG